MQEVISTPPVSDRSSSYRKEKKLAELRNLWEDSGDILERRRRRLGLFYKDE